MDLIEITTMDLLAENASGIHFENWFMYGWRNDVMTFHNISRRDVKNTNNNICFTIDNDHIELYGSYFEEEPQTEYVPPIGGRLTTLVMKATVRIKSGIMRGEMCIRNVSQPPIYTDYEFTVKNTDLKMIVGLSIVEDSLMYDHCQYTYPINDLSFLYGDENEMVSIFDKVKDLSQQKLLEQFLLKHFIKDLCPAIEDYQLSCLHIKQSVSGLCGQDDYAADVLKLHNAVMHEAFKILSVKIIDLTNALIDQASIKLPLNNLYALYDTNENDEEILKVYKGNLSNLNTMKMIDDKNVIISNEGDLVIVHVPIKFEKLILECNEVAIDHQDDDEVNNEKKNEVVNRTLSYTTSDAYFIISLKRLNKDKVHFELLDFKIMDFVPLSKYRIDMAMDYLVSFAIEESIKLSLSQALKDECLHELAINPNMSDFEDKYRKEGKFISDTFLGIDELEEEEREMLKLEAKQREKEELEAKEREKEEVAKEGEKEEAAKEGEKEEAAKEGEKEEAGKEGKKAGEEKGEE